MASVFSKEFWLGPDMDKVARDMNNSITQAGSNYKTNVNALYSDPNVSGGAFREVNDNHAGYKGEGYSLANVDKYINPALEFAQKQAMNQIQGSAAGGGNLFSGSTAREIANSTNQLAYQAYQDALGHSTAETARLDGNADANAARSLNVQNINNAGRAGERDHFTGLADRRAGVEGDLYQGQVSGAQAAAGAKASQKGMLPQMMDLGVSAAKIYSGITKPGTGA